MHSVAQQNWSDLKTNVIAFITDDVQDDYVLFELVDTGSSCVLRRHQRVHVAYLVTTALQRYCDFSINRQS